MVVYVWRQDGFDGPISLTAQGLPVGVTCEAQTIDGVSRLSALVITASEKAADWTGLFTVTGTATIDGKPVSRLARSATIVWSMPNNGGQQMALNTPTQTRLARGLALAVRDQAPLRLSHALKPITVASGEKIAITLTIERTSSDTKQPIHVYPVILPPNIVAPGNNNQAIFMNAPGAKVESKLSLDVRPNVPPGTHVMLFRAQTDLPKGKNNQRSGSPIGVTSQTVMVTVLPRDLATVKVSPDNLTLKAGEATTVKVQIKRLGGFSGAFRVEMLPNEGTKRLESTPVTIAAGQNSIDLEIRAVKDAKPKDLPKVEIQASAQLPSGKTVSSIGSLRVQVK